MADEGVLHEAFLFTEKAKDLGHIRAEKLVKGDTNSIDHQKIALE